MRVLLFICAALVFFTFFTSCEEEYTPRPRGYFRIDLPEKEYVRFDTTCPYSFLYPRYSVISTNPAHRSEPCWINIDFPKQNATLHLSYKRLDKDVRTVLEDARSLAYKHTIKANDIREIPVIRDTARVYGLIYDIRGNAASSYQFYLTDSTRHFIRGALYFNNPPNYDSVLPVLEFLRKDVDVMVGSFRWK